MLVQIHLKSGLQAIAKKYGIRWGTKETYTHSYTHTKNKKNCSYKGINNVRHVHCPSWRRWLHALIYSRVYDVWETMCMRAAYHVTPQITKGVENVNVLHIGFELLNYLSNNNVWERSERIKFDAIAQCSYNTNRAFCCIACQIKPNEIDSDDATKEISEIKIGN